MQRGIRAAKLRQVSVGVFLRTDIGFILIGDAIQASWCLVLFRDVSLEIGLCKNEVLELYATCMQMKAN